MQQLDERLKEQYPSLSPQEQRVADFIFDHFDDLISYNSAELAQLSGVSKATVSRLFKRLGYEKYKDMRDELRTLRQSGMPLTDNRDAVQGNTLLARHYKQEMANLTQWVNALDVQQFAEAIQALVAARRIVIVGMRNAYPAALHLRQQLLQARGQVLVLPQPGQGLSEELVDQRRRPGGGDGIPPPPANHSPSAAAATEQRYSGAADVRAAGPRSVSTGALAALRAAG